MHCCVLHNNVSEFQNPGLLQWVRLDVSVLLFQDAVECCPSPGASGWIVLCGSSQRALGHLRNAHQMGSPQGYQVLKLPCYSPRKILLTLICGGCVSPGWAAPSPCVTIPNHHNHSVSALGHKPAC